MIVTEARTVAAEQLRWTCVAADLGFETTADLEPEERSLLGQDRALEALRFGVEMQKGGYNLFALGPTGVGKHDVVRTVLTRAARERETPADWCYVFDFENTTRPRALRLPPGRADVLRADMEQLVADLKTAIPAVFESDDYRTRRRAIEEEMEQRHLSGMEEFQRRAAERKIAVIRTPTGVGLAPTRDGKVMEPEDFEALDEEEKKAFQAGIEELEEELQALLRTIPNEVRALNRRLQQLDQQMTRQAVSSFLDELRQKHRDLADVLRYLDEVQDDVMEHAESFLPVPHQQERPWLGRYSVNVLVGGNDDGGAPVVFEDLPTYHRLIGEIEHVSRMGTLVTEFTLIKPGALHRANGGYLVIDARRLIQQPFAYDALKQALRSREIRIEQPDRAFFAVNTRSLEPEPIELDVKVVLVGERILYYLLAQYDPEFDELFRVAVDFEERIDRQGDRPREHALLLAALAREDGLRPFHRDAVARILEQSARLAGDSERLSIVTGQLQELLRESDHFCAAAGRDVVQAEDVECTIQAAERRSGRVRERLLEETRRGTIVVRTEGREIGQVNGLAVLSMGRTCFGRPSRITARVRLGKGEVIDIEREVKLGGPFHSKGVLILQGFIGQRYAAERPLSLSASLVFEQSYGLVDGDSASSTELYALLSALAELPILQSFAVTGSVDQHGRVQAIGGVNEKIEGFFDLCQARGLDGDQGVLIPAANVKHLMLDQRVVDAVSAGRFRVIAVETIDQGIEILTGVPAGVRDANGVYPEGSVNRRAEDRLVHLSQRLKEFSSGGSGEES